MLETWKLAGIDFKRLGEPASDNGMAQLLLERSREMGIFLSYYYRSEGAVVENVSMATHKTVTPSRGKLTVRFDLVHFNACLNIHEEGKETMELDYEAFPDKGELFLTGPYWPEREPDGY